MLDAEVAAITLRQEVAARQVQLAGRPGTLVRFSHCAWLAFALGSYLCTLRSGSFLFVLLTEI